MKAFKKQRKNYEELNKQLNKSKDLSKLDIADKLRKNKSLKDILVDGMIAESSDPDCSLSKTVTPFLKSDTSPFTPSPKNKG